MHMENQQQLPTILSKAINVSSISTVALVGVSSISNVALVGSSIGALYQKLCIQSKSSPEDGRIFRPKHIGLN